MPISGAIALVKWTVFDVFLCFFADFSTGVAATYVVVDASDTSDTSDFTLTIFCLLALQPRVTECETTKYSPNPIYIHDTYVHVHPLINARTKNG